ncbi:MAG: polysaccharide deacetylase family protein [Salinisphaera sp.]|uniref:polysaccharide deacetylase family protein n=1 Tax=Salinisphaera sp. TaxID=1914330 RepID=UPI003C7C2E20
MTFDISSLKYRAKLAILHVSKRLGVFRLTRLIARKKLLILCYHGFEVADESAFRPLLFMQEHVFRRRLEMIRRAGLPVLGLEEAVTRMNNKTLPANAVCLTIDDGFYSTLTCAAPALREHGFPATLYSTTYYVANASPVFGLVVQYMFWATNAEVLDTTDQPWGLQQPVDLTKPALRDRAMNHILKAGKTRFDERGRQRISESLGEKLGVSYASIVSSRLFSFLTPQQLARMPDFDIDVQLHTHRHRFPTAEEAEARAEIAENAEFLENVLQRPPVHFCYPSGMWSPRQWAWLADLGVETATTCDPGLNTKTTPPLALYRFLDSNDLSEIEFEAELYGFSELARQLSGRRRRAKLERAQAEQEHIVGVE